MGAIADIFSPPKPQVITRTIPTVAATPLPTQADPKVAAADRAAQLAADKRKGFPKTVLTATGLGDVPTSSLTRKTLGGGAVQQG
jgi:hypothetical protein